jgi:hypothetical protein
MFMNMERRQKNLSCPINEMTHRSLAHSRKKEKKTRSTRIYILKEHQNFLTMYRRRKMIPRNTDYIDVSFTF